MYTKQTWKVNNLKVHFPGAVKWGLDQTRGWKQLPDVEQRWVKNALWPRCSPCPLLVLSLLHCQLSSQAPATRSLSLLCCRKRQINKQVLCCQWEKWFLSVSAIKGGWFYYKALHYSASRAEWSSSISALFHSGPWSPTRTAGLLHWQAESDLQN